MKHLLLAASAVLMTSGMCVPAVAQSESPMLNEPSANWSVYGAGQTHKPHKDKDVQGGGAIRVTIPSKPANVWDIGASTPITKPIHKGDKLVFAFWVKLIAGGVDGKSELAANIQMSSAPYTAIVSGKVQIIGEWKLVHVEGVAAADFPAGAANAALSLGGAAHTFDLGPAFVITAN